MAKKASKAAVATVPPAATTFNELAELYKAVKGPDDDLMRALNANAWQLVLGVKDRIDWNEYGIPTDPFECGDNSWNCWKMFVYWVGSQGNIRNAYPDVIHAKMPRNQANPRNEEAWAYAEVCDWLDRISSETNEDRLERLRRSASDHSDPHYWQRMWDWRDYLANDDAELKRLHDLTNCDKIGIPGLDKRIINTTYQRAIHAADLVKMCRDYDLLGYSLRKHFPKLFGLLPAVRCTMRSRPSDAEVTTFCQKCREIESELLIEQSKTPGENGSKTPWTPEEEKEARRLIEAGGITKAGQLPEKMEIKRDRGLLLYRHITGKAKKPHHSS